MKVIFFGKLRDALGDESDLVAEQGETVAQLRRRLADLHPAASRDLLNPGVRACVDDVIVTEDFIVGDRESVEFLPPLSGG
ncbi:MAG TPA: MoaD/ThiS family protein [Allosphingosinicella sp.]|nr:MoaD/ThiS family protein [Allosphingosinicella sp.]